MPPVLIHTPYSTAILDKQTGCQLVKKYPAFYGTRRIINVLTSARQLPLSWASKIQSIPPTSYFLKIQYYPSIYSWVSQMVYFFQVPPTKTLYTLLHSPISATCSAHLILLDFITRKLYWVSSTDHSLAEVLMALYRIPKFEGTISWFGRTK